MMLLRIVESTSLSSLLMQWEWEVTFFVEVIPLLFMEFFIECFIHVSVWFSVLVGVILLIGFSIPFTVCKWGLLYWNGKGFHIASSSFLWYCVIHNRKMPGRMLLLFAKSFAIMRRENGFYFDLPSFFFSILCWHSGLSTQSMSWFFCWSKQTAYRRGNHKETWCVCQHAPAKCWSLWRWRGN